MTLRAVLFDAGATLLHADPPVEEVYAEAFARDGARAGREEILEALALAWREIREKKLADRYGGVIGEQAFWRTLVERARERLDGGTVSEACFGSMVEHFLRPESWKVFPDVDETLSTLEQKGLKLAIVSNWDSTLPSLLRAHGLDGRFAAVCVSAIEQTGKPAPEIFLRACRRLEVAPSEALHVGDSLEEDFEAARRAGVGAVLLDRLGRHPDVSPRVTSLSEIPPLLGLLA